MSRLIPSIRWRKVWRDLSIDKTRTALVVLSLAVGIFTVSFLVNTESVLRIAFDRQFAAVNPSSATLSIPEGFDQDFVKTIRRMPEIQAAEGRRSVTLRLKAGANQWIDLNISAIDDFGDIRINKVEPAEGAWPPAKGEILLERTSLRMAAMPDVSIGETLTIHTASGEERTLKLGGVAIDFNRTPSSGTGTAYGFATLETVERLGEPTDLNTLCIIVAPAARQLDKEYILRVTNQVKAKVEDSGRSVAAIAVPDPGLHPLGLLLDALGIVLGALGVLTLVGGALVVTNTIVAVLAQQVRQIGMMKSIGARAGQIAAMYLGMASIFGLLALIIATPLAILGGIQFAKFLADFFNLDLNAVQIPNRVFAVEALIGLGIPVLAALYPIFSGTRVTVREALADYGIQNSKFKIQESKFDLTKQFKTRLGISNFELRITNLLSRPIRLSLRNTFRRKLRLVLTLLPLVLSGAILTTVINVRASLIDEVDNIFSYKNYDLNISFERPYRLAEIENAVLKTPGVVRVEGYYETRDAYRLSAGTDHTKNIFVRGVSPTTRTVRLPLAAGRWLVPQDRESVVINEAFLRDQPDIHLGDRILFKINGRKITLQVAGIVTEKMAPAGMYVNESFFAEKLGGAGRVNNLWVMIAPDGLSENSKKNLEARFDQAGLSVGSTKTVSEERGFIEFHFNIMIIPLGLAALLLALVGGLGLMGTMSTNVLERQREIGVMRAIGASDQGVRQIFIVEGVFIGLISWLLGWVTALPLTYLLDDLLGNKFLYAPLAIEFSSAGALIWLVIVSVTAALSSYVPAQNAAQTSVRALLAYE